MTSGFDEIFSRFMLKVTDYSFVEMEDDLVYDMMIGWMVSTLSKPYVRRIFSSLVVDEDLEEIEFELANPEDEQSDADYAMEVIATGMVVEWVTPQVNSVINTQQMFSGKELQLTQKYVQLAAMGNLAVYSFVYAGKSLEP